MICPRCKHEVAAGSETCPVCSLPIPALENEGPVPEGPVGYSDRIEDPVFKKRALQNKKNFIIVGYLAAAIFLVATPLLAVTSGDMSLPVGVGIGCSIAFFFAYFATIQWKALQLDTTWDGVVEERDVETRSGKKNTEFHKICVRRDDSGKSQWFTFQEGPALTHYYPIGAKIRHHRGLGYFEKYDKRGDMNVICVYCGKFTEIEADRCDHCRLPLLK